MKLVRDDQNPDRTLGTLRTDEDEYVCETLELPWRENQHGISCIPAGTYECVRFDSPHIGYQLFQLQNVPGRSGVDIHRGNTTKDTEGCILVGTKRGVLNGQDAVLHSTEAFADFMRRLEGVDTFTLEVGDADATREVLGKG